MAVHGGGDKGSDSSRHFEGREAVELGGEVGCWRARGELSLAVCWLLLLLDGDQRALLQLAIAWAPPSWQWIRCAVERQWRRGGGSGEECRAVKQRLKDGREKNARWPSRM